MKQQPGVMLYFDVRESIAQLSYEEKGMLLDAILDYGQNAAEPNFADRTLALIWPFVRKDIHRDAQRYRERQAAGRRGAQRRWETESPAVCDSKPMAEDGREMANDGKSMANLPSAPATPSAPASSTASAAASQTAAADAETASPSPPASALPRTNGSHLPDIVAQYLPTKPTPPAEAARLKAEALAKLRALPPDAW